MQNYTEENTWNSTPSVARADMSENVVKHTIPPHVHIALMDPLPDILNMPEMTDEQLKKMEESAHEWALWMLRTTDEDAKLIQFSRMSRLDRKFVHAALVRLRGKRKYSRSEV